MILRPYQARTLDSLWDWLREHDQGNPIIKACVGAGKSLMIAGVAQRAEAEFPGTRILVLVHQKELLEQNLAKLKAVWPEADVGVISAAIGKKQIGHQITYATIGSVYKLALKLGRIDIVMADECHLINSKEAGMWRTFLKDLRLTCPHTRVFGWTGTDFRGNGVWLTAGEEALFTHVAASVEMTELLELGFLAPLVPAQTKTRIATDDVATSGGDYVVSALAKATDKAELVEAAADEIVELGRDRKRWLVFAVTVEHAEHVRDALKARGVAAEMISGDTPKGERDRLIGERGAYRTGAVKCLVNVGVLTTGFDVPAVDFIALLRATKSPVLYVQIAGRGMRVVGKDIHESIANGKANCLWADFTSTTVDLGPVDQVKGRPPAARGAAEAPFRLCPQCGSRNKAGARACTSCGHEFPEPERIKHGDQVNGAQVLSTGEAQTKAVRITDVYYDRHTKPGSPDSMRVEYVDGIKVVAREWVCFDHPGFARRKAETWWQQRSPYPPPPSTSDAVAYAPGNLRQPVAVTLTTAGKYPEIVSFDWS